MAQAIFEDNFEVLEKDPDGKYFDKGAGHGGDGKDSIPSYILSSRWLACSVALQMP